MSFFKKIANSVTNTVKAVVKDVVPITAGVLTGGASLSVLKPTALMERLDKATGLPVSAVANALNPGGFMGGGEVAQQQSVYETQNYVQPLSQVSTSPQNYVQPQNNTSVYDQISPYLTSLLQSSQNRQENASNSVMMAPQPMQPQSSSSGGMKIGMIIAGIVALGAGMFFLKRRGK